MKNKHKLIYIISSAVTAAALLALVGVFIFYDRDSSTQITDPPKAKKLEVVTMSVTTPPPPPPTTPLPTPPTTPPSQGSIGVNLPPSSNVDPTKPMIALTFDDGPSGQTLRILDALEKHGGRATFFVTGERIEEGESTIKKIASLDCEVAGHSWTHSELTLISSDNIRKELLNTNKAIEEIVGFAPNFYRPPYGSVDENVKDISQELGLAIINWSVDSNDWRTRNSNSVYNTVMYGAHDKGIILSHDLYDFTASAFELVIPELIEQGYQLVTVSELIYYSEKDFKAGELYHSGLE